MLKIGKTDKLGPVMETWLMEKLGFGKKTNCGNHEIRVQDGNKVTGKVLRRIKILYKSKSQWSFD